MGKYTVFSVVVLILVETVCTTNHVPENSLKSSVFVISEPYEIVAKQGRSLYSNLGKVNARNCGGTGRLIQWRNEACTRYTIEGICVFTIGQQHRAEVSFIPSESTESLSALTVVKDNQGEQYTYTSPNISTTGPIKAGKEYAYKTGIIAGPMLQGKLVTVHLEFYRESDKVVEACTEAEFLMV